MKKIFVLAAFAAFTYASNAQSQSQQAPAANTSTELVVKDAVVSGDAIDKPAQKDKKSCCAAKKEKACGDEAKKDDKKCATKKSCCAKKSEAKAEIKKEETK